MLKSKLILLVKEELSKGVPGGASNKYSISDMRHKYKTSTDNIITKLTSGTKIELQYTENMDLAMEIAFENLWQDFNFYDRVQKEDIDKPVNPGILKKRLGKLSCSKVRRERSKLKNKGTTYAKALQRYLNYHCK